MDKMLSNLQFLQNYVLVSAQYVRAVQKKERYLLKDTIPAEPLMIGADRTLYAFIEWFFFTITIFYGHIIHFFWCIILRLLRSVLLALLIKK